MKISKVFKTKNDTILIVEANTVGCNGRPYISVTAYEISPIATDQAIEQQMEYLEDGELWRMAVAAGHTTEGLYDWIDNIDPLEFFDNSLYDETICIDGNDYIFKSLSCGCIHEEIKEVTKEFDRLIDMHLKDDVEYLELANQILKGMENDDVDDMVLKYTIEIIEVN